MIFATADIKLRPACGHVLRWLSTEEVHCDSCGYDDVWTPDETGGCDV